MLKPSPKELTGNQPYFCCRKPPSIMTMPSVPTPTEYMETGFLLYGWAAMPPFKIRAPREVSLAELPASMSGGATSDFSDALITSGRSSDRERELTEEEKAANRRRVLAHLARLRMETKSSGDEERCVERAPVRRRRSLRRRSKSRCSSSSSSSEQ